MSGDQPKVGSIIWYDVTVDKAEEIRDFYESVVGWKTKACDMGEYSDYSMIEPATGNDAAGICHARGPNADLPHQWLAYIVVEDVEQSAKRCVEQGGQVVTGPRPMGDGGLCVIRDPAGAVCALYQPSKEQS